MPQGFVRVYLPLWAAACLLALALTAARPAAFTLLRSAYWRWLLQPWKLVTFAVAFAIMVGIAPYSGDPTWDHVDGGVQSLLTFMTAPWAVGTLYRGLRRVGTAPAPRELYGASCAWLFSASWFYDAWLYHRDHVYPTGWALNMGASSALYLLAGLLWSLRAGEKRRVALAFASPDWPSPGDSTFRRVGWVALAVMAGVIALLAPFAWMAWQALRPPEPTARPPVSVSLSPSRFAIDPARMKRDVETLAGFGTRHTLSDTTSPTRGIGAARLWILAELQRAASGTRMRVELESHSQPGDGKRLLHDTEIANVVAVLPGVMPEAASRRYYVVGHYDSRTADVMDGASDAPGANDDASGVAVVLELARVMAHQPFDATLVFLSTAGEEQGLYGAKLHARKVKEAGEDVRAVLNDDIVGDPSGGGAGTIRVFSEGLPSEMPDGGLEEIRRLAAESDSPSRELARFIVEVARSTRSAVEPRLVFRADRFLRGGDHLAFAELGFPAVRFTTPFESYDRQHTPGDVPAFVDAGYIANVARLEAETLARLADAPSPPEQARVITAELTNDTVLRWSACKEPDVAGYEVVWRETTSPSWQGARDVGPQLDVRLPLSKDDYFFGVRSYDKSGLRSPVAFAKAARS
jgi:Zn-dependent M28 family amino/carboxypeptidase